MGEENHAGRTSYTVLTLAHDQDWRVVAQVDANNAQAACLKAAETLDPGDLEDGLDMRAVNDRAWNAGIATVTVRHETRIVLA